MWHGAACGGIQHYFGYSRVTDSSPTSEGQVWGAGINKTRGQTPPSLDNIEPVRAMVPAVLDSRLLPAISSASTHVIERNGKS